MKKFKSRNCTVIIPGYRAHKWVDECLDSIPSDMRVLVGVDGCKDTLEAVKARGRSDLLRAYFFEDNHGPYVVRNTLVPMTETDWILFLDADDYLKNDAVDILSSSGKSCIKRFRFGTFEEDPETGRKTNRRRKCGMYAQGCFAVTRKVFLDSKGFHPWKCAADTEFKDRVDSAYRTVYIDDPVFIRRRHPEALTRRSETALKSELRTSYLDRIGKCGAPTELCTAECERIL